MGVYFGAPCYGYALNCLFVYLIIQGTRSLFKRKQKFFILFTCNLETRSQFLVGLAPDIYVTCITESQHGEFS